jgi:hypothetical protein
MALSEEQKHFIEMKVTSLGGMKKAEELYNKDCAVDKYAREFAQKIYTTPITLTRTK